MGVQVKTIKDDLGNMKKNLESLNGKKVDVGVFDEEEAWLAAIHEYGVNIMVTPKMRAYLNEKGLHLKASTNRIVIPERSFLRAGFDQGHESVILEADKTMGSVIDGELSIEAFLDLMGEDLAETIKSFARDLKEPKKHPFTIKMEGEENLLTDTGKMIKSITWKVE